MFRLMKNVLFAVAILTAVSVPAFAESQLVLRQEAYVEGPQILLGDIAEIDSDRYEELADIEISVAPLPGQSKQLQAGLVQSRIEHAGIPAEEFNLAGPRLVKTTTLHLEVSPETLEQDLREFIDVHMPWPAANATVDLVVPTFQVVVPMGDITIDWRPTPTYEYVGSGSFRGEIRVDGDLKKTVLCRANIEAYGEVVVAAAEIPRGQPVTSSNVTTQVAAISTLKTGAVTSVQSILGQVARSTIFPGQVITERQVLPPLLIKRGQVVLVEARMGSLVVRTRAKARSDGRLGEIINCENTESKTEFQGVVREDGVVEVP